MSKEKIILVGSGGHCQSVIEVIESGNDFEIAGLVDVPEKLGYSLSGYKVIATDKDLVRLAREFKNFLITIGQIRSSEVRFDLSQSLDKLDVNFPVIIAPTAWVSPKTRLGKGTVVMHKAFINAGVTIGMHCILNTGCIVEHNAIINDFTHISTSAVVNGDCQIASHCFIGSNAVLSQGIMVEDNCIIGAGSVVINNTSPNSIYIGNPARRKSYA